MSLIAHPIKTLRHLLFYLLSNGTGVWFGVTGWLFGWLPYSIRYPYIIYWNRCFLWLAKILMGVDAKLLGESNLLDKPCVVMSKHHSQWETFYLQTLFNPLCTVLKKELLSIPFFGWGLARLEPIAIDRSNPKGALRQIQNVGSERLKQDRKLLIFPEGTRIEWGKKGKYAKSGAALAIANGVPVIPVAHNAGKYWPGEFFKNPGTITVSVGEPIDPAGKSAAELTREVECWIETECNRIDRLDA